MEVNSIIVPNILRAKCLVLGESQTGKTSLCRQLTNLGPQSNYVMTHLMEPVVTKSVVIPDSANDVVELFLLDCSGKNSVYEDELEMLWTQIDLVVMVYDVCRERTFTEVPKWWERLKRRVAVSRLKGGVLVANKTDLSDRRVVSPKNGLAMAEELGLTYFEASDKNGVEDPFFFLAARFHKDHSERLREIGVEE